MKTTISFIKHPHRERVTFALTIKIGRRTVTHYLRSKPTKKFIRATKRETREFIKSGLLPHEHDLFKCL